jgi:hypothetical protein
MMRNETSLLLTLGRNDNSGWIVEIELEGLVGSLEPVRSKVLENKFRKHTYYSIDTDRERVRSRSRSRSKRARKN